MENNCLLITLSTFTIFIFFQLCLLKRYDKCKKIIQDNIVIGEVVSESNYNDSINDNDSINNNNENNVINDENNYYQDILIVI